MKKTIISILLVLVFVAGCGKVPKLENGKEAVVTLDGEDISVDDLYNELKEDSLNTLLNMIDNKLFSKQYPSSDDEDDYIDNQMDTIEYYYENYYKSSYDSFLAYIQAQGFDTEDDLKDYFSLAYKRKQAVKDYTKDNITDKEINKYYKNEIYGDITTSHILVTAKYDDGASESEIAAAEKKALNTAKSIIKKIKSADDFDTLIEKYNKDSSSNVSGEKLPAFNKGQQTDEYEAAALKLKVGEYTTTPVKDKYGYHIILKTAQADKPKLSEVKDDIISTLADEKINSSDYYQYKILIKIREKYNVEIQDSTLKKKYKSYVSNINNQS